MSTQLGSKCLTKEEQEFVGRLLASNVAFSLSKVLLVNTDKVTDKLKYADSYFRANSNQPAPLLSAEEFATKIYVRFLKHYEDSGGDDGSVLQDIYNNLVFELGMEDLECRRKKAWQTPRYTE